MHSLREVIKQAEKNKVAVGHFNVSNIEGLWGIFKAAKGFGLPVVIGTSEGERKFIGPRQAVALVKSLREEYDYPIFINADHCYSFDSVKETIDAGYDAVIFDGAKLPIKENIKITKQCIEYAKSVNSGVVVEGELGYIGESSKLLDKIPEGVSPKNLTTAEDAKNFVEETGVDLFSPSVGNIHGMLKHAHNPKLNIDRIKEIKKAVNIPLVLHGGSGIYDDDFTNAIKAGISIVHINTEIRLAYKDAVKMSLQDNPDEIVPYKFMKPAIEAVQKVVEKRLKLFNNIN